MSISPLFLTPGQKPPSEATRAVVFATWDLIDYALDLFLDDDAVVHHPVDLLPEEDPALLRAMLALIQATLLPRLVSDHTPNCPAASPAAIIGAVRTVLYSDCTPTRDLRTVIRHARIPTSHVEKAFDEDPGYWLVYGAVVTAALLARMEDPYGLTELLLAEAQTELSLAE